MSEKSTKCHSLEKGNLIINCTIMYEEIPNQVGDDNYGLLGQFLSIFSRNMKYLPIIDIFQIKVKPMPIILIMILLHLGQSFVQKQIK